MRSASAYGYDTLERYGPRPLDAWAAALGPLKLATERAAVAVVG